MMETPENNLLRRENLVRQPETPSFQSDLEVAARTRRKSLALDIVSILCAAFFGFAYHSFLAGICSPWLVVVSLFLFGAAEGIQAFVTTKGRHRFGVILLEI